MEYYFNNLDATSFQRLINSILVARFGEDARLTPLRGADGGRDGETAPGNPNFEYQISKTLKIQSHLFAPLRKGRYLFQVKHHRTADTRISDARKVVLADFQEEFKHNVLTRTGINRVNYFFLITNVPSSRNALASLDKIREDLIRDKNIHADIWWQEQVIAYLDLMPSLWNSFPSLFAGGVVPLLAEIYEDSKREIPRAIRMTLERQYNRDSSVRFRQIDLEKSLTKLFVSLNVGIGHLSSEEQQCLSTSLPSKDDLPFEKTSDLSASPYGMELRLNITSATNLLTEENLTSNRKILLEGGPGQGKSTITQMIAQIYRETILRKNDLEPEGRWKPPSKIRLPFRIELKYFAEWLNENTDASVEEYLAHVINRSSGGISISIDNIHTVIEKSPVLLIFDGLDEVGNDDLRDSIIEKINDCIGRFESVLHSDLRVILTTRPPAIAGRRDRLIDFVHFSILPMDDDIIQGYVTRWLSVQPQEDPEQIEEISESFKQRRNEAHVKALITNPMQLSVLLHFIKLKGPAFPNRRAELYRDYFKVVIDRDVEKSAGLRKNREVIEHLHQLLGYKIHALTEVEQSDGTLNRTQLLDIVASWLKAQGNATLSPRDLFKLGEERLGLIVSTKGEGEETRYGYEIQPIREYFAAAYINDQIKGNAHDVFQAMVRRSFWREVALFLAGLRRPNEKADLLARARQLDQDSSLGWRQDGRLLTLQLLQEGVFSQPQHVYLDAVDFLTDLLDPEKVNIQVEFGDNKNILNILPPLIKDGEVQHYVDRILDLWEKYKLGPDSHILYRLFRVLSHLVEPDKLRKLIMHYESSSPEVLARVRLAWPYGSGIDMRKEAHSSSYWDGVPKSEWAVKWWITANINNLATNLPAPLHYHQNLFVRFASEPHSVRSFDKEIKKPLSNWAIWRLHLYLKLFFVTHNEEDLNNYSSLIKSVSRSNINFAGLTAKTRAAAKDLIDGSKQVLQALMIREAPIEKPVADYVSVLNKYLAKPGLEGWIACKCAITFLKNIRFVYFIDKEPLSLKKRQIQHYILTSKDGNYLINTLRAFYGAPPKARTRYRHKTEAFDFLETGNRIHIWDPSPQYIRLNKTGGLIALVDLYSAYFLGKKELPYSWMKSIVLSTSILPSLVKECSKDIGRLFNGIKDFSFVPNEPAGAIKLNKQDILRLVKTALASDEKQFISKLMMILSTTRCITIVGADNFLKLLKAETKGLVYSTGLFESPKFLTEYMYGRERGEKTALEETQITTQISKAILEAPKDFSFGIVLAAATYLIERLPIHFLPLKSEEEILGI